MLAIKGVVLGVPLFCFGLHGGAVKPGADGPQSLLGSGESTAIRAGRGCEPAAPKRACEPPTTSTLRETKNVVATANSAIEPEECLGFCTKEVASLYPLAIRALQ